MRLYRVSYKDHGPDVRLEPRVPESRHHDEDSKTLRICVAPRIADCLRLFPWKDYCQKVFVYEARVPKNHNYPIRCSDGQIPDFEHGKKEEFWLTRPTYFKRIGRARFYRILSVINHRACRFWSWTGREVPPGERDADDEYRLWGSPLKKAREMEIQRHMQMRQFRTEIGRNMKKKVGKW